MPDRLELRAGDALAVVAPLGAELRRLRFGELDVLREADALWPATSPVLFPIVGWARDGQVRVHGRPFPMPVHGFASACQFEPDFVAPDRLRLCLRESAGTRRHYPFAFGLVLEYRLTETDLSIVLEVTNSDSLPMPYACGLHPGFRWPLAGAAPEEHEVLFDEPEEPHVPVIAPGGLFSDARRPVPLEGRRLPLTSELFAREALCFLDARSRGLTFGGGSGPRLRIEVENLPHLALWARPPSPFLSIEAWTGHGDPVGFSGELAEKPSMRLLAPGESARHAMRISRIS